MFVSFFLSLFTQITDKSCRKARDEKRNWGEPEGELKAESEIFYLSQGKYFISTQKTIST